MFRKLKENEIECRVASIKQKGLSLLLYKDARCDMNILDETVGAMGWKREHTRENKNCIVSIWDEDKRQWISKEDTGTESYTEKEKGLASDSFKRACFNWGIGRELYTSPFIWINSSMYNGKEKNGKWSTFTKFKVSKIGYDDNGFISELQIINDKNQVVFQMGVIQEELEEVAATELEEARKMYIDECVRLNLNPEQAQKVQGLTQKSTKEKIAIAKNELYKFKGQF